MMTKAHKTILVFALLICCLGLPAMASTVIGNVITDGPIVIGDQLYSGGELSISKVGSGELLAISINGERVALMYRDQIQRRLTEAKPELVLRRDERGFYHLAASVSGKTRSIAMAAARQGLSTVPNYLPLRPHSGEAVATR